MEERERSRTADVGHGEGRHEERRTERQRMVERHLRARGVRHERVLRAMAEVPRELFVPEEHRESAYEPEPIPTERRPMLEPYAAAVLLERLDPEPGRRVLDLDAGTGYRAAVLGACGCEVFVLHRQEAGERVRSALQAAGLANRVRLRAGRMEEGWPEEAPYDRIVLPGAAAEFPTALADQLAPDGEALSLLLQPVSPADEERVPVIRRYRLQDGVLRLVDEGEDDPLLEEAAGVTSAPRPGEKRGEPVETEKLEAPRPRDERGMNPGAGPR